MDEKDFSPSALVFGVILYQFGMHFGNGINPNFPFLDELKSTIKLRQMLVQENYRTDEEEITLLPAGATPIQLIGLIEALEQMDSPIELSRVAARYQGQTPNLLAILRAGEELGLLKILQEKVSLTNLGHGFVRATDSKIRIMRAGISRLEPFKTTLAILSKKDSVSGREVARTLARKYPHDRVDETAISPLLVEWGISAELLIYDGRKSRFHLA